MKTFAVMSGKKVINVIVCESKELAEEITGFPCIEYNSKKSAGIGYLYDEISDKFTIPELS